MKTKSLFIFALVLGLNFFIITIAKAEARIYDIKLGALQEGKTQVTWMTSEPTTGYVYFGNSQDNMPFYVGDSNLSQSHTVDLTGLKKSKDYYYKIITTDKNGGKSESFINYFDTNKMIDTRAAIISNTKVLQTTDTAFAVSFSTDEPVKITFKYGTSTNLLNKTWSNNNYVQEHFVIITGLKASTAYVFEIVAKDKDGNLSTGTGNATTVSQSYNEIKLSNLVPEGYNQAPLMPEAALITWTSNILATADISYGVSPKSLNKVVKITATSSLNHKANLSKLEPNTTYYYRIKMKSDLNKKSFESQIYSFKTAPMTSAYLNQYFQNGDLVKYKNVTYLLYNDTKTAINNSEKIKSLNVKTIKTIEDKYFKQYKDSAAYWGVYNDGQLIKEAKGSTVYLIDGNLKRPILKWEVLQYLNYGKKDIVIAQANQLKSYKLGTAIKSSKEITNSSLNNKLIKSTNGTTVYLVANGKKMPFSSQAIFLKKGYKFSDVKTITDSEIKNIPDGQVIL
jgi:hypothetical protein